MPNTIITSKAIKVFLADMIQSMPYVIGASKSHFSDQLTGKKNGRDYYFVLRDAGNPTDGLAVSASDDATIVEKQVKLTVKHKKSIVELDVLQAIVDLGDFKTEVADTYAVKLGTKIQSDIIDANIYKATVATFPKAGSNSWSALTKAGAHLRATRNGAKLTGYLSSDASANLTVDALNGFHFAPSTVGDKLYADNSIGKFGGVDYTEVTDLPILTVPTASAISGISAVSATSTDGVGTLYVSAPAGNTATLPAGLPLQLSNAYACNSVGSETKTKFSFILQSAVTLNGTALIPATVQSIIAEDIGARNIYISGVNAASAVSGALTCPLSASVEYDVAQVRCNDVMNWDNVPLADLSSGKSSSASVGGIDMKVTEHGDWDNMVNKTRWDVSYIAGIVDERLVVDAYLPRV